MMFWVKNLIMFSSLIIICDKMLNQSDFLQLWKIFNLTRILINLLEFCEFIELLKMNLLSVFLHLQNCIVCHFCKQFIRTWKSTALIWVKINFEISTVQFFSTENWLKIFWKKFSQITSFLDLFWERLSQNVSFCVAVETADNWLKSVWKKLFWMFLSNSINTVEASAYLYNLIE